MCGIEPCAVLANFDGACTDVKHQNNLVLVLQGDPEGSVEEFVALTDVRLTSSLCQEDALTELPQFKITHFTIYDEHGHVCPFDGGLIETDVSLYMSGHVKSIVAEDSGIEDSVSVSRAGPIGSWWTTGYDGGSNVVLGLTTAFADYVLMSPSKQYECYIARMQEKMYLVKGILEHLLDKGDSVPYDHVVSHLERLPGLPNGVGPFSADSLHRHAQFVIDHIQAYDSAGTSKDSPLLGSVFVRELTQVTGAVIRDIGQKNGSLALGSGKRTKRSEAKSSVLSFLMPSIKTSIGTLFTGRKDVVASTVGVRKNRCGVCEPCLATDCRSCVFCKNMKKYGGTGTFKQCCVRRRCDNRDIRGSHDQMTMDSMDVLVASLPQKPFPKRRFPLSVARVKHQWLTKQLKPKSPEDKVFYTSVKVGKDLVVKIGDDVLVRSAYVDTSNYVGRVVLLFECDSKGLAHVVWFRRQNETLLGDFFSEKAEVFLTSECDDVPLAAIAETCSVSVTINENCRESACGDYYCTSVCDVASCTFQEISPEKGVTCCCSILGEMSADPQDIPYKSGDCVFIKPEAAPVSLRRRPLRVKEDGVSSASQVDDSIYSERYRKHLAPPKIEDSLAPEPLRICLIVSVRRKKNHTSLKVQVLYRAEEVIEEPCDSHCLFFSNTTFEIGVADIVSSAEVIYSSGAVLGSIFDFVKPPFYFTEMYEPNSGSFFQVSEEAKSVGRLLAPDLSYTKSLLSVDVYCGCGGLSLGLRESCLAKPVLAVTDNETHRDTFQANFPDVAVPRVDPRVVLKQLTLGESTIMGNEISKQDIKLLCGSPSFESLKNYRAPVNGDSTAFLESQVATFLSFCAFFEPLFVVLAAERGIVQYHNGAVLALVFKCFLDLGYQASCSVLQDGCYGVPQRNRRLVIFATRRGITLPRFPRPTHTFEVPMNHLSFVVDGRTYSSALDPTSAAPYRRVTLLDAIGDLCKVKSSTYNVTEFQAHLQREGPPPALACKKMTPLAQARIAAIPKVPGADWRDLPNMEVQLSDGTTAYELIYTHHTPGNFKTRRGVCACSEDSSSQCDPMFRQASTLIPWSLVHTGHKHDHWCGVYGRLQWDGYLHGVVSNPDPLSRRGPVIHPEEDRVISVRECARVQGYPDDFQFRGDVLDQYQQIAGSVPPLVAQAIGAEILKYVP